MQRATLGHVDIRVRSRQEARPFYSVLMPALGFTEFDQGKEFDTFAAPGDPPFRPWFGYTEDPHHRANGNRIAFAVASREEVDRLTAIAIDAGAHDVSGPKVVAHYDPGYYASFFADPFGNLLEIVFTEA